LKRPRGCLGQPTMSSTGRRMYIPFGRPSRRPRTHHRPPPNHRPTSFCCRSLWRKQDHRSQRRWLRRHRPPPPLHRQRRRRPASRSICARYAYRRMGTMIVFAFSASAITISTPAALIHGSGEGTCVRSANALLMDNMKCRKQTKPNWTELSAGGDRMTTAMTTSERIQVAWKCL